MKSNDISFRLVSYTDAAGKYSPDAFRGGNEDNFFVDDDLSDNTTNRAGQDEVIKLGERGMLMVVADGMGGTNAGEIASQIAIDTVKAAFIASSLTNAIVSSSNSRQKYLEQVIKTADKNIKKEARNDRDREGMGSTIIIAWLFENELTISWCGDSRAYLYNEKSGIRLISRDHSYVQELVNKGLLTYDQTFDHPQNNIITRSLGDPTKDAKAESKTIKVGKGDIILLCSDGLSGVLRDRKTYDANRNLLPDENIEDIIKANTSSMKLCREALWAAAEKSGWYDNVTAIICQITDGPESVWSAKPNNIDKHKRPHIKRVAIISILIFVIIAAIAIAFFIGKGSNSVPISVPSDSIQSATDTIAPKRVDNSKTSNPSKEEPKSNISKPTVQEQIRKQTEEKADSVHRPNGLTKIEKEDDKKSNGINERGKLSPKEDKLNNAKNPLNPTIPQKDNITNSPIRNH